MPFLVLKLYGGHSLTILQVTFGIKIWFGCRIYLWMTFLQLQTKLCHYSWFGMKLFFPAKLCLANISHLKDSTSYFCSCTHLWFCYFGGECSYCDCLWLPWCFVWCCNSLKLYFGWISYWRCGFLGNGYLVGVKKLAYFRCDTFTVWWVKPYNVPLENFVFFFMVTCTWGVVS